MEIMKRENTNLMQFDSFDKALSWGKMIAESSFCPKEFKGKTGDVLVAIQYGQELGLQPMQALQNICVIGGKPSLYGDAMLAVCKSSNLFEYCVETFDEESYTAICKVKRKGQPEAIRTFNKKDAQEANLWGKPGPWKQYPKRMLQMRARGFGLRDEFADLLKGMYCYEEMIGINTEKDIIPTPLKLVDVKKEKSIISEQTLSSLEFVINMLSIDKETQNKWLNKANVDSLSKLTEEQGSALLKKYNCEIDKINAEESDKQKQWNDPMEEIT